MPRRKAMDRATRGVPGAGKSSFSTLENGTASSGVYTHIGLCFSGSAILAQCLSITTHRSIATLRVPSSALFIYSVVRILAINSVTPRMVCVVLKMRCFRGCGAPVSLL